MACFPVATFPLVCALLMRVGMGLSSLYPSWETHSYIMKVRGRQGAEASYEAVSSLAV